jgi:hypothetical protein
MERPIIIDEIAVKGRYDFRDGFYINYVHYYRVFKDMSLYGKTEYQVLNVDIDSNFPEPDLAAFKYFIREKYNDLPRRIAHYLE